MVFRPIVIKVAADASLPPLERHNEPVSVGVACPRGAVAPAQRWRLTDQRGRPVTVQTTALDRWNDGSLRWLLAEFHADLLPGLASWYALAPDAIEESEAPLIAIEHSGESLRIGTGAAIFDVPCNGPGFLSAAAVGELPLLRSTVIGAEDAEGARCEFHTQRAIVERAGPLRAVVRLQGGFAKACGGHWLDGTVQLVFFGGLSTVIAQVQVTNPRAARHAGGCWDLGDSGSVLIRDLSISIATNPGEPADVWGSLHHNDRMEPAGTQFAVYQDSSGGSNWQHLNHVNRDNRVTTTFRGFRAMRNGRFVEGMRATPIASIGGGNSRVSIALPRFWQIFPKSIEAEHGRCVIGMFPRVSVDLHELQGGERSSLTFAVCFGRDTVSAEPLSWIRAPLSVSADPLSYRQAQTWTPVAVGSQVSIDGYDALVNAAIDGSESFEHRREVVDEYGWRNFGELYADHENPNGDDAFVSHYNNQYDALAGFLIRFMQTADQRWWLLANDLASHVTNIDLYHTQRDRTAYNGGYFWPTQHYQTAGTGTHRAFSRRSGSSGGGPSSEHNYTTGLMLHHFMTGCERSRAAVIQLANWVIDMDDGWKSRFRWIDRRETGYASGTRSADFHGPGRGAGNSINALLDAHRLTSDNRYMEKAEALIARCVHPDDEIDALGLLDIENRWSYTVFLQVLGKYLEHKAERGEIGPRFEYARRVLIKYAVWMAANERPYLESPEQLDHPTETWAAQDLRKAAVFEFAARYSESEQQSMFLAAAARFVDHSVAYLLGARTARRTKPIILLLAYAFQRPHREPPAIVTDQQPAWQPKAHFVPQRRRVVRRLTWAGAGASAAALLLIALLAS
jgi:hypothetical protein